MLNTSNGVIDVFQFFLLTPLYFYSFRQAGGVSETVNTRFGSDPRPETQGQRLEHLAVFWQECASVCYW